MSYIGTGYRKTRNLLVAPAPPIPPSGPYVWLDGSTLGANGASIAVWANSGSGPSAGNIGIAVPVVSASFDGAGNKGALFNAACAIGWIGGLDFTGVQGITVCGVVRSAAANGAVLIESFQTRPWGVFYDVGQLGVYTTVSVVSDAAFPNAQLYAFEMQQPRDGSAAPRFWKNGWTAAGVGGSAILSVENAPAATAVGITLSVTNGWAGVVGDLLIYKRQFTAADRTQWQTYISTKYGL